MDNIVHHGVCLKCPCTQDVCRIPYVTIVKAYRQFVEAFELDKNARFHSLLA